RVTTTHNQKNQKRFRGLPHTWTFVSIWEQIDGNRGSDSLDAAINTSNDALPAPVAEQEVTNRFLSPFARVHHGEGIGALLLAGHVFLLLSAYYILKTVRESLILSEGGAEIKAYSSAAQATLLLFIIPAYGWL